METATPTPTETVAPGPVALYADQMNSALAIGHAVLLVVVLAAAVACVYFGIQIVRAIRP